MIEALRIDERLIHGQVANQWSKALGFNAIVVANDQATTDRMMQMALRMAAPGGNIKIVIKTVDEACTLLNDPRCNDLKIFVVCNNPFDALKLIKNVKGIPCVNVGNFGRIGFTTLEQSGRKQFSESIYANEEEVACFKEMIATGVECNYRMLPDQPKVSLASIIK